MDTRSLLLELKQIKPGTRTYAQALRNVLDGTALSDPSYKATMDEWFNCRKEHLAQLGGSELSDHAAVLVPRILLPLNTPAGRIEMMSAAIGLGAAVALPLILGSLLMLPLGLLVGVIVTAIIQDVRNRDLKRRLSRLRLPQESSVTWYEVSSDDEQHWTLGA